MEVNALGESFTPRSQRYMEPHQANANILYVHKSRSIFAVSNYHHSVMLKTFLKYINRSPSEDTKAAYMGYEDCLVLHVFTTDINSSLPGSRGQQIG